MSGLGEALHLMFILSIVGIISIFVGVGTCSYGVYKLYKNYDIVKVEEKEERKETEEDEE